MHPTKNFGFTKNGRRTQYNFFFLQCDLTVRRHLGSSSSFFVRETRAREEENSRRFAGISLDCLFLAQLSFYVPQIFCLYSISIFIFILLVKVFFNTFRREQQQQTSSSCSFYDLSISFLYFPFNWPKINCPNTSSKFKSCFELAIEVKPSSKKLRLKNKVFIFEKTIVDYRVVDILKKEMNSNSGKRGPIDDINERRKRRRTISNDLLRGKTNECAIKKRSNLIV